MDPGTKLRDPGNFSQGVPNTPPYDNVVGSHEASDQTLDDEWSLSGFSNVGSDTQMGSASFESENSPSSGNALRQTIFDPGESVNKHETDDFSFKVFPINLSLSTS